jgi:hypothetical protein
MRFIRASAAAGVILVIIASALVAGGPAAQAGPPSSMARTLYTGIDPGVGHFYTYAPSVIQTSPTTRDVFDCENYKSNVVHDNVYLSVGHLIKGQWQYGPLKAVFGPMDDPNPHGYFSIHACEPEVVGGKFHFGGQPYQWALLFTAESAPTNSSNQLGIAFANNPAGPWKPDLTPIVQTADDFGHNPYRFDCPPGLYCLGQPAAIDYGPSGHILVTYMSNAGSPGNDTAPAEGLVLRELNLSNVPASGPCAKCLAALPDGKTIQAVPTSGLSFPPDDASIGFDATTGDIVLSYDGGPPNSDLDEAPVTPYVTVATMSESAFLSGVGTWDVLGDVGSCVSGHSLNHNSAIIRQPDGTMPNGNELSMMYTVANHNLHTVWGVWGYRIWSLDTPLGSGLLQEPAASGDCSGYDVLTSDGQVNGGTATAPSASVAPATPAVGLALTPDRQGSYVLHANGAVVTLGDATAQPRPAGLPATPSGLVGLAVDPVTDGYWVAAANGAVYAANAPSLGSLLGRKHSGTVVAIAPTPAGVGYYLVTSTGQVFTYGHAQNFGGLPATAGQTITAIATTPDGLGYYLLSATGSITAYGDASLFGPSVVPGLTGQADSIAVSPDGLGYVVASSSGQIVPYGDAGSATGAAVPAGAQPVALAFF